jgi:hypothetical protein
MIGHASVLSPVIMPKLAYAKQRTGRQMGSRALGCRLHFRWILTGPALAAARKAAFDEAEPSSSACVTTRRVRAAPLPRREPQRLRWASSRF